MSFFGSSTAPAYAASKGAVAQLTKSLAMAWASQSIRCNAVAPGWIDTAMTQSLQGNAERFGRVLSRTPLARLGTPRRDRGGRGVPGLAARRLHQRGGVAGGRGLFDPRAVSARGLRGPRCVSVSVHLGADVEVSAASI